MTTASKWTTCADPLAKATALARIAESMIDAENAKTHALSHDGPELVRTAIGGGSLRELSRRTGYSPTYLSLVMNGAQRISLRAYAVLARIALKDAESTARNGGSDE